MMEERAPARLHTPDTAFLMEYWDTVKRKGFVEPEKYLMLAVLKDGFLDLTRNRSSDDRRFKQAQNWFFLDQSKRLFSFETICEFLNLSPAFIRRQLAAFNQANNKRSQSARRRLRPILTRL